MTDRSDRCDGAEPTRSSPLIGALFVGVLFVALVACGFVLASLAIALF